jgi:hypothetical protein
VNEEAIARAGLQSQRKLIIMIIIIVTEISFATPCNVQLLKTKVYEVT